MSHDPFCLPLTHQSKLPRHHGNGPHRDLPASFSLSARASHLRSTPPSSEALRHSGGDRRRCTSPTVTLYLELELSSERRPGTEQKTSAGLDRAERPRPSLASADRDEPFSLDGTGTAEEAQRLSDRARARAHAWILR